jgi:hypothetical protein
LAKLFDAVNIDEVTMGFQKKRAMAKDKLIDWSLQDSRYMGMKFSDDFKGSIERYLLQGLKPGGFGEAMLACDLERALYSADTHNRQVFWAVAIWVRQHMPGGSWGSYEAVEAWCRDEDGRRSEFRDTWEKERVWLTLVK